MDCLVTKLKGVVDNDNLLKFGEVRLKVTNGVITLLNRIQDVPTGDSVTVNALGNVRLNGETSIELPYNTWTNNVAITGLNEGETGYIQILNKYPILGILAKNSLVVDDFVENFAGMNLTQFEFKSLNGTLSEIVKQFPALARLNIKGNGLSGRISDLYPIKNTLANLEANYNNYSGGGPVKGTMAELGHLHLINSWLNTPSELKVTGSINEFVSARLQENPETAGSASFNWLSTTNVVTYTGQATVGGESITYNNERIQTWQFNVVTWDAQGNITLTQSGKHI